MNADDPIASPGLEGVFIDSGGFVFFFFLFSRYFCLLSSLFRAKSVFVEALFMDFDTGAVVGSTAARTPCSPPPPSLVPSLSLSLAFFV